MRNYTQRVVPEARRSRKPNYCRLCHTDISQLGWQAKFCRPCGEHRRYHYKLPLHEVPPLTMHTECQGCSTPFNEPQPNPMCFTTTNPKRSTCTKACMQWKTAHPGVLRILEKECAWCFTPFIGTSARQKYCTRICRTRSCQERRNRRTRDCYVEQVSKPVVAKRDKWCCQLCRKKVNPTLQWPHPMSWSLDHVIPISRGGEHSYAKTQRFELMWYVQPLFCRFGRHDSCDVVEHDASVQRSFCLRCFVATPPLSPRPADPEQARWLADIQAAVDEHKRRGSV